MNIFKERPLLHFLSGAIRFDVFAGHQYVFSMNSVQFFPEQNPQIGLLRCWTTASSFSSPQPINNTFVVNVHHRKTDSFHDEKPRTSYALHLASRTSRASTPSPHYDQAAPPTSRIHCTCLYSQKRAIGGSVIPQLFDWSAPTFVFFWFPPPHCQVVFLPLTFTQRARRGSSLPLPIFL